MDDAVDPVVPWPAGIAADGSHVEVVVVEDDGEGHDPYVFFLSAVVDIGDPYDLEPVLAEIHCLIQLVQYVEG